MAEAGALQSPSKALSLGDTIWSPPEPLVERARAARRRRLMDAVLTFVAAIFAIGLAGATFSDASGVAGSFAIVGALLLLFSFWVWRSAGPAGELYLSVLKGGVLMPGSFANLPGMETFSGPRFIPLGEIARAEDLRRPEGRAVLVWTQGGTGAVVAERVGAVRLSREEQERVLDDFIAALKTIGVKVRSPDDLDGPPAAAATLEES